MPSSVLIVLVLVLCIATVAGAYVAWMLDQGRRGIVPARRRRRVSFRRFWGKG